IEDINNKRKSYITRTQKDGYYTFFNIPAGTYRFNTFFYQETRATTEVNIAGKIEFADPIVVKPHTFTTVNNILIKTVPAKAQFIKKAKFNYYYSEEDEKNLEHWIKNQDKKEWWQDYQWVRLTPKSIDDFENIGFDQTIKNFITIAVKEKESADNLFDQGDYYIALLKYYNYIDNLFKAYYHNTTREKELPEEIVTIYDLSKTFDGNLSGNHKLLLVDLSDFYTKSINNDVLNRSYQDIFTKGYVNEYIIRIDGLASWLEERISTDNKKLLEKLQITSEEKPEE
ncbi:MAG: hypothetical protein MJB14_09235, partial [Spirochaetes bacterium]|nr:hypothetical protein [Spirochaetota bacterium]